MGFIMGVGVYCTCTCVCNVWACMCMYIRICAAHMCLDVHLCTCIHVYVRMFTVWACMSANGLHEQMYCLSLQEAEGQSHAAGLREYDSNQGTGREVREVVGETCGGHTHVTTHSLILIHVHLDPVTILSHNHYIP